MDYNSLNILIPYQYASRLVTLSWDEILFMIKEKLFEENAAVQHAIELLSEDEDLPYSVIELSCLKNGESIHPYIDDLTKDKLDEEDGDKIKNKFMFLLLDWVFENKDSFSDPLEVVEIIYADFDYPPEISKFVRYMPADEPLQDTIEKNILRLYEKWKNYLDKQKNIFKIN